MKITEFVPEMWLSDVEPIEAFPSTPSIRVELAKRCLLFIRDIAGRAISSGNPADIGYALQEISQTLLYRCSTEVIFEIKSADRIDGLLELYRDLEIADLNSRGEL